MMTMTALIVFISAAMLSLGVALGWLAKDYEECRQKLEERKYTEHRRRAEEIKRARDCTARLAESCGHK
ncbi:MAG: hypothetical protein Q4P20_10285 [Eubacteriales bacterium]|nr:hypothetical protein [Eubacteriales bacterium]